MLTLYQVQTGDSWASGVARPVVAHKPVLALFFVGYVAVINICVLNVIVAIMVENVMKSTMIETEEEKQRWAAEREQRIFTEILRVFRTTAQGDASISRDEWQDAMADSDTKAVFSSLNITSNQLEMMFDVVDIDGSGSIDLPEFIESIRYGLREVRSMDINAIQVDLWRMSTAISHQLEHLPEIHAARADVHCGIAALRADVQALKAKAWSGGSAMEEC